MAHAAERLPVTLDANSYQVDPSGYSRTTVPLLREQRDTSSEAGEQQLNTQYWLRSQTDWSYGAGQHFFDNDDSERRRFYTSSGVDPWTKGELSLLRVTEDKGNTGNDVIMKIFMNGGTEYMYVASGTDLYYSQNFEDASPTWNTVTALASPQTITDFTSDGVTVFVAYGTALKLHTTPIGTTTQPSILTGHSTLPDFVRFVSGRLIEMDANHIGEIAANGTIVAGSLDFDTIDHNLTWVDVAAGPTGVYAAANTEDVGSIYFCSTGVDGLLDQPAQVADLPHGETINAIESYGGLLIMATSKGLRVASVGGGRDGGGVTYGPVIDDGGPAYSLATDDRFVWFGAANGQLYRADLSVFTDTLVPAWASDVVSTGGSPGNVTWIARADGETFFVDAANGVQGEAASRNKVASGTLTVGDIRWNSIFDKVLRQVDVRAEPTLAIATATAYEEAGETYDDADLVYNGLLSPVSGAIKGTFTPDTGIDLPVLTLTDRNPVDVAYSLSDKYTFKITLERDATTLTAGPILQSWQIIAYPAPTRIDEIVLPILMQKRVASSRGMGAAVQQDPQGQYDTVRTLMTTKQVVTYQEGSRSEQVVVDQMSMSADRLSADGDWWEGTMTVRLLTVP
ncbi:MAG: hypothetical protein ACPGT1_08950 [Ilumatobacteraceae bacterium]